jgi:predicted Zn finger-like uncharacterized protein
VVFVCPQCKDRLRLKDQSISSAGEVIRCPSCTHAFVVKAADEAQAASPTPSARPAPAASVDPAVLRKLSAKRAGGRSGIVARIVNTYVVTSQKLLSTIRDAVEAGDWEAFVSAAHTFASSSAHFGALRLSSVCEDLEALGRRGSCEGARELVNRISEEFESVQEELAEEDLTKRAPTEAMDPKGATDRAKQDALPGRPAPAKIKRSDPPAAASQRKESSRSTGTHPAAPQSRVSAGNPPRRAAGGNSAPRKMPRGPGGLSGARLERRDAPAAPPPAPTASTPSIEQVALQQTIEQVALQQTLVAPGDVHAEERSQADPRWRRLIRDSRGVMPWAIGSVKRWASSGVKRWASSGAKRWAGSVKRWASSGAKRWAGSGLKPWAIGGGVSLVVLVLVNLLWLSSAQPDPEPRLAAPSSGAAADGPVPAPRHPVSKPAVLADRGASSAVPAEPNVTSAALAEPDPTTATAPALTASIPHAATAALAPEVAPTTPRTAARQAAKPPRRATRTPKTQSVTSHSSSGRRKAVPTQKEPPTTWGGWTVKKEPSKRSQSTRTEAHTGWNIEH